MPGPIPVWLFSALKVSCALKPTNSPYLAHLASTQLLVLANATLANLDICVQLPILLTDKLVMMVKATPPTTRTKSTLLDGTLTVCKLTATPLLPTCLLQTNRLVPCSAPVSSTPKRALLIVQFAQ
jgi:hypothetical protein